MTHKDLCCSWMNLCFWANLLNEWFMIHSVVVATCHINVICRKGYLKCPTIVWNGQSQTRPVIFFLTSGVIQTAKCVRWPIKSEDLTGTNVVCWRYNGTEVDNSWCELCCEFRLYFELNKLTEAIQYSMFNELNFEFWEWNKTSEAHSNCLIEMNDPFSLSYLCQIFFTLLLWGISLVILSSRRGQLSEEPLLFPLSGVGAFGPDFNMI